MRLGRIQHDRIRKAPPHGRRDHPDIWSGHPYCTGVCGRVVTAVATGRLPTRRVTSGFDFASISACGIGADLIVHPVEVRYCRRNGQTTMASRGLSLTHRCTWCSALTRPKLRAERAPLGSVRNGAFVEDGLARLAGAVGRGSVPDRVREDGGVLGLAQQRQHSARHLRIGGCAW